MYVTRRVGIIALMVLGSVALWIASPLFWMWLTAKLQQGTQASMGPYAVMLIGFIATSIAIGKGLGALNRALGTTVEIHLPWNVQVAREVSALDVVMVGSVVIAALALAIWFFVVEPAPPGLPGGPGGAKQ